LKGYSTSKYLFRSLQVGDIKLRDKGLRGMLGMLVQACNPSYLEGKDLGGKLSKIFARLRFHQWLSMVVHSCYFSCVGSTSRMIIVHIARAQRKTLCQK
jgi:hypothetical protein